MLSRAMKLSPILLLTLNIWAGCCCVGSGCASEVAQFSDKMEMAKQAKAKKSCHSKNDSVKMAHSDSQTKAPIVNRACECGNHQRAQADFFTLPTQKEVTVSAPLILFFQWVEPADAQDQAHYQSVFSATLVSDRLAPRLSVLARFLI